MERWIESWKRASFVSVQVEEVQEDEERRGPKTDEDAEPFGMGDGVGSVMVEEPPDPDGRQDRSEPGEETEIRQGTANGGVRCLGTVSLGQAAGYTGID